MFTIACALLAFSGSHFAPVRTSSVQMSVQSDVKNGLATLALASAALMPMASQAVVMDMPTSSVVAFKPAVKKVDLGDEPNKLKKGLAGLGLTTGFRSPKAKVQAKAFKPPSSANIFKGSFATK